MRMTSEVRNIPGVAFVSNALRYELPAPSSGRMNDVSAWTECVENSQAQLEHQRLR